MPSGLGLLCLFPLLNFFCCGYSWPEENTSAYEALQQYDFPVGLLPEGATGYDLNPSTGEFSAYLNATSCTFRLTNSFQLRYKSTISGVISKDRLRKLRGVSVKVVKHWFKIVEVRRDGESLVFSVGFTSANFPVKDFLVSPKCGCGFSCNVSTGDHGMHQSSPYHLHLSS